MSDMDKKIRVGVVGVGSLGQHHVRIYSQLPNVELVGIVDQNRERALAVAAQRNACVLDHPDDLLGKVDCISLAVPTVDHAALGTHFLKNGVDVLVEKPIAVSLEEADALIDAAREHGRILQVGHIERFNPAVTAARQILKSPKFFEIHRLSEFTPRSLDIDVVLDLMIHDLDILLTFVQAPITDLRAVGLPILTPKVDIANVRIEFADGCVANLTASRVSTEKIRKLRFFQPNEYVSVDYTRQEMLVLQLQRDEKNDMKIDGRRVAEPPQEPLKLELQAFMDSIRTRSIPQVTGEQGRHALEVAGLINRKIQEHAAVALSR
ncbi:MAG: Gfo/Idh/MocA family oxidoreductase [Acidobacteriia bacterium]|nr:Gfo/Idh/MocA family oxidoreductase [Terriglobia bacterium]